MESADHFLQAIGQPIKATRMTTFSRSKNSLGTLLKTSDWFNLNQAASDEKIESEMNLSREKEDEGSESIDCLSPPTHGADQLLSMECQPKSASSEQVLPTVFGDKEVILQEKLAGVEGQQICRRKVPIEIEEKFFQNYFDSESDSVLSGMQFVNLPTCQARSESERMLAD